LGGSQHSQSLFPIMWTRQYHFIDKSRARQFRQIAGPSHNVFSLAFSVVQKAAYRPAQLGMLLQMLCQSMAQSPSSHNKDVSHATRSCASRVSLVFGAARCQQGARVQNASDLGEDGLHPVLALPLSPQFRPAQRTNAGSVLCGGVQGKSARAPQRATRIRRGFWLWFLAATGRSHSRDKASGPRDFLIVLLPGME
jgi:hypothetical protein